MRIKIGTVAGAQGLRGEIKMRHDSGDSEQLSRLPSFFIREKEYTVENLRFQKQTPIFKLQGIDDRNAAEALIGAEIFADEELLRPQEQGTYLVSDLAGLEVVDKCGRPLGKISATLDNPAHDLLEITKENGEKFLLPFIDAFISEVDVAAGFVRAELPEGI